MIEIIIIDVQKYFKMNEPMEKTNSRFHIWALTKANSRKAPIWLGVLFFMELVLFIPLDAILMFFCLENRKKIFLYIGIATAFSILSGLIGYLVGHFLWDLIGSYIVPHFISSSSFNRLSGQLQTYENWTVFIGALIPFPLKALSLTAGVFHLALLPFCIYLSMARLLRFLILVMAILFWGEKIKCFVDRHFQKILVVLGAKIAMIFTLFWALAK
jgi:membrane protein YqaA with SNARE-associated domain